VVLNFTRKPSKEFYEKKVEPGWSYLKMIKNIMFFSQIFYFIRNITTYFYRVIVFNMFYALLIFRV